MRIQTLSIVTGTAACNAKCPFCVSKMTPDAKLLTSVNWDNFRVACNLAEKCGVTTAMFTGKGEPTLHPDQITEYLRVMDRKFPIVELQTNGLKFMPEENEDAERRMEHYLDDWHRMGLTTVAISIAHYERQHNAEIYTPGRGYMDLPRLIKKLHGLGLSVRLACTMLQGHIDSVTQLKFLLDFARENLVEQLTVRPVAAPEATANDDMKRWVKAHMVPEERIFSIRDMAGKEGTLLMTLPHGARVYDMDGQNLCLTDCLTIDSHSDDLRQIIFFPDGHIRYDWRYKGATIL